MDTKQTASREPLLECSGFPIEPFEIPPFVARRGEITRLAFPENSFEASVARDVLLALLAEASDSGDTSLHARVGVVVARPAVPFRRLSTLFRRQSLSYWLRRTTGRGEEDVTAQLSSAELDPQLLMWHASGNPRTALGILEALNSPAEILVFWTSGMCDPLGVRGVLNLVNTQLGDRAGIYVSSPVDRRWSEFSFASDVEIARLAETTNQRAAG